MAVTERPRGTGQTRSTARPVPAQRLPLVPEAVADWVASRTTAFGTPAGSYYVLIGATLALTVFGLVMVLSSSSVNAMDASGSPFSVFVRQVLFALVGLPLMWLLSRVPVRVLRRFAWPALLAGLATQLLVFTPLGHEVNGNLNWIRIGGFNAQPSEAVKLALVLWVAGVLATKGRLVQQWQHALMPVGLGGGVALALVLLGHDVGTAAVIMLVLGAMLFVAGAPLRLFVVGGLGAFAAAVPLVLSSASRSSRVTAWLSGECEDYAGVCFQAIHGKYALASGGITGLGLGASREKWSYLPEEDNDFIFAIIGEELGLIGTFLLLAFFAAIALAMLRIIRRHNDPFVKIATAGILAWIVGQAIVNIAVVVGVLPVLGIPLPLVSRGGSALVACLAALGVVLGFARQEPGAADVLSTRPTMLSRLAVLGTGGPRRSRRRP
ncbi:MAG: putative lipid II flippase FtsW [Micrococcales bacterium]|nr:MAG: putative lipid II flippase FtsW [Micrococcales bacterium]PIE27312.1 MAG: putative lipid II flippase FtsW [Micrococcales bacterium]